MATTPAFFSEPMGASSSPLSSFEIAPVGKTLTDAGRCLMKAIVPVLSATGAVFGMQTTDVKPPRAAQRVPVSMVSLSLRPGSRRCTCMSIKPGTTSLPVASMSSPSADEATILPPSMKTSRTSSTLLGGSMNRPFFIFMFSPGAEKQDGHTHREPIGDLLQDDRAGAIGDLAVNFYAAVDG